MSNSIVNLLNSKLSFHLKKKFVKHAKAAARPVLLSNMQI